MKIAAESKKAGVPTPVNDRVVEIIREIEAGTRAPGMANLDPFGPA